MATILYGIKNCDTVKKTCDWLENAGIKFQFHDFRQSGLSKTKLNAWLDILGTDRLINRRSTTWKQLNDSERADIDAGKGSLTILANPTLIKRPVLEHAGQIYNGFDSDNYNKIFKGK